jgi:hypothetical protein
MEFVFQIQIKCSIFLFKIKLNLKTLIIITKNCGSIDNNTELLSRPMWMEGEFVKVV